MLNRYPGAQTFAICLDRRPEENGFHPFVHVLATAKIHCSIAPSIRFTKSTLPPGHRRWPRGHFSWPPQASPDWPLTSQVQIRGGSREIGGPHHCFRVMQSPEGICENNPIMGFSTPRLGARQSPSAMVKYRRVPRMEAKSIEEVLGWRLPLGVETAGTCPRLLAQN